jgi:3-oxoacyl-[acyl-carrier-protein] synthase-3
VTNRSLLWPGARTKLPESDVMMKVGFEAIVRFVPEEVIPKEHFDYLKPALAKLPESLREQFSIVPEEVRKYKGGEGDRAELMAIAIAKEALDRAGLRPSDIDYVIGAAVSLHKELGLDLDTPMLNIANCCASFVDSCQIAWNLVKSGACRRVLVVASAALAGGPNGGTTDLTDAIAPIFGDGAAAAVVSSENLTCEFLSYYGETDGTCYRSARGEVRPLANPDLAEAAGVPCGLGPYFCMDDISYIEVASKKGYLIDSLRKAFQRADLPLSAMDMVICHHLGDCEVSWIQDLVDAGLSADKYKNLRLKTGNTGHTDLPTDLVQFVEDGLVRKGSVVALWVPGSGISLGCLVLRWLV